MNNSVHIVIYDPNGTVLDTISYDDQAPWPTSPDGQGPSLILCDVNSDNLDAGSWTAATTPSGTTSDGADLFGSPGY